MDNTTANKGHIPCQLWTGQINWSADPTQGALLNPLSSSQQLGLCSSADPRPVYDHLQVSSLNCLNNLSTRGNTHHTSLFKAPQISGTSSASLFANTSAIPSTSHVIPFAQLSQTPLIQTSNHGKRVSSLHHTNQGSLSRHLELSSHESYKAPFQPTLTSLTNTPQDVPVSLQSCSQHSSQDPLSKSTFDGTGMDSSTVTGYTNSPTVPAQEQPQWVSSLHCRESKNKSADAQPTQNETTLPQVSNESRLALIHQREELLKKLSDLDELLKVMPPVVNQNEPASPAAGPAPLSNDLPSQESHEESGDFSGGPEVPLVESEDDGNPDFFPSSEDDFSDFMSHSENGSSDESTHNKSPCSPRLKEKQKAKSRSPNVKDKQTIPLKRKHTTNQNKILVLQCVSKKGKRVYDKKNYCLFCSKPFSKLSRHLEMVHGDQAEVAVAFQYPKHSKERLKIWNRLKNKGNYAHNKDVLKSGKGFLAAVKRPKIPVQDYEFVHCLYCQGLYISKGLFRHMKKCPEKIKNEDEPKIGKRRLAFRCVLETLGPDISDGLKGLLSPMINDPVTQAILNHRIILQLGENMFKQHGADHNRHEHIRQNLRQIARLVLEAQKLTPLKELDDFFVPANFNHVVSAVNVLAGYNSKNNTYSRPSLAIKLGYQLQKICSIVENNAINSGDESKAKSAQSFLEIYKKKWNKLVSAGALTTLKETKRVKEKNVPSVQDVKRLNSYMANVHAVAENKFGEHVSAETYASLAKVILGRIILFNRRKPGEVSGLKLTDFLSRKTYHAHNYIGVSLSDLERTMCRFFTRIEIRGNCGRIVPVLLKQSFVLALELLVNNRETCGVPAENPFLFARPSALTAYSGSTTLQSFVKECGAQSPEMLTTAKIRMHFAAMLQMLNLDENEANQILGPNYQVLQQSSRCDTVDPHGEGTCQDIGTQTSAQWNHSQFSANCIKPPGYYHDETPPAATPAHSMALPKRSTTDKKHKAPQKNGKQKWDEAEVRAVERHMMHFIQGQKVPQKFDCIQCLDAEPDALRTRSWKGVKDYVRNRITALKREESRSSTKTLPSTSNWPPQDGSGGYYQQL